jgi:PD-(D/E)XK endonuclease
VEPVLPKPDLTSHPVDVGTRHEAAILGELIRRGYSVLVPWGVNQRYDLVLDLNGKFVRAQCKTGRIRNGAIRFPLKSIRSNTSGWKSRGYVGDVELFLVFCPDNQRIYAVPIEECPSREGCLRITPTANRQSRGVRWARDYELPE